VWDVDAPSGCVLWKHDEHCMPGEGIVCAPAGGVHGVVGGRCHFLSSYPVRAIAHRATSLASAVADGAPTAVMLRRGAGIRVRRNW
jgi:hypothetical protein